MDANLLLGISMGCLIGLLAGLSVLLTLRDAYGPQRRASGFWGRHLGRQKSGLKLIARISTIPVFAFGWPWAASATLRGVDWNDVLPIYTVTLVLVLLLITVVPITVMIVDVSRRIR